MSDREIAVEAIAEGYRILWLFSAECGKEQWMMNSIPLSELDRLATELGFCDARSLCMTVEYNREWHEDEMRDAIEEQ